MGLVPPTLCVPKFRGRLSALLVRKEWGTRSWELNSR